MRSQVLAVFAVLAASVSSMSIGHTSNQPAHRRHAASVHESVIQARGARRAVPVEDLSDMAKRDSTVPRRRKRGINQRRCAPKTTTTLLQTTSVASTSSAAPTSSAEPTTTPEPEPTTSSKAESSTTPKAKSTKTSQTPTKTSTSEKPTATSDDDSGSSSGETFTGQATFYDTGLGACGITSTNSDKIAAVSMLLFDGFAGYTGGNPNSNPICGKKIKATYEGKSVTVTVVDRCVGCAMRDLDFSPTAFDQLADQSLGRLSGMTWEFV